MIHIINPAVSLYYYFFPSDLKERSEWDLFINFIQIWNDKRHESSQDYKTQAIKESRNLSYDCSLRIDPSYTRALLSFSNLESMTSVIWL